MSAGWICYHLERAVWSEGALYPDYIAVCHGVLLCSIDNDRSLWVSQLLHMRDGENKYIHKMFLLQTHHNILKRVLSPFIIPCIEVAQLLF